MYVTIIIVVVVVRAEFWKEWVGQFAVVAFKATGTKATGVSDARENSARVRNEVEVTIRSLLFGRVYLLFEI